MVFLKREILNQMLAQLLIKLTFKKKAKTYQMAPPKNFILFWKKGFYKSPPKNSLSKEKV